MELNDKIKNLTPYEPITGEYKIRLDANESYIEYSCVGKVNAKQLNRYPDPYAVKLCEAFAKHYGVDVENVTAGNGSDELISLIVGAFFSHGDTVLTLSNDFSMYQFYGNVFGINVDVFQKKDDLTIDVDQLITYINERKIAGLVFSNPCNPTSLCLPREEVLRLCNAVDALVVVDEAYMDFANQSIIDAVPPNVIVLKTCSKAVGLAAIRLGFAVANLPITTALKAVKSPYNVNSITQSVGEMVLLDSDYINKCTQLLIASKDSLYRGLCALNCPKFETIYESSTNFIFIKTAYAKAIYEKLLSYSIAVRYMGDYLRITAGSERENSELIAVLREILG